MRSSKLSILVLTAAFAYVPPSIASEQDRTDIDCRDETAGVNLLIAVTGVRNARGAISINLYPDAPDDFMKKGKWVERVRVPAQAGEVSACMPVPQSGRYAVSLFHDENNDRRLGRNWIGIPSEGYGFSRDAPTPLRLPHFEEAVITTGPGINRLRIKMRY